MLRRPRRARRATPLLSFYFHFFDLFFGFVARQMSGLSFSLVDFLVLNERWPGQDASGDSVGSDAALLDHDASASPQRVRRPQVGFVEAS